MSFSDILNKLAEKKALQGDTKFAYNLISIAEKSAEKTDEEKKAEMIKRGKDKKKKASTLELLIQKYAGTKVAAFDPDQPEVPDELYEEAYNAFIEYLMDYYEESREEAIERAESDGMRAKKSNFIDNYIMDYEQDAYEDSFDDRHEEASTRETTRKASLEKGAQGFKGFLNKYKPLTVDEVDNFKPAPKMRDFDLTFKKPKMMDEAPDMMDEAPEMMDEAPEMTDGAADIEDEQAGEPGVGGAKKKPRKPKVYYAVPPDSWVKEIKIDLGNNTLEVISEGNDKLELWRYEKYNINAPNSKDPALRGYAKEYREKFLNKIKELDRSGWAEGTGRAFNGWKGKFIKGPINNDGEAKIVDKKIHLASSKTNSKQADVSELQKMIYKYAGKEGKGSFKNKIKEMDGFLRMDGKAFCFENNAQAKKALAVAETAANFLNWQVMKGDGCFKLMEVGMDDTTKKKNNLKQASTFDEFLEKLRSERNQPVVKQQSQEERDAYIDGLYDQSIGKFRSERYPEGPIQNAYLNGYDEAMKHEEKHNERDAHSMQRTIFAQPNFDDFDVPESGTTVEELDENVFGGDPEKQNIDAQLELAASAFIEGYNQGSENPENYENNPYDMNSQGLEHEAYKKGYNLALSDQEMKGERL